MVTRCRRCRQVEATRGRVACWIVASDGCEVALVVVVDVEMVLEGCGHQLARRVIVDLQLPVGGGVFPADCLPGRGELVVELVLVGLCSGLEGAVERKMRQCGRWCRRYVSSDRRVAVASRLSAWGGH